MTEYPPNDQLRASSIRCGHKVDDRGDHCRRQPHLPGRGCTDGFAVVRANRFRLTDILAGVRRVWSQASLFQTAGRTWAGRFRAYGKIPVFSFAILFSVQASHALDFGQLNGFVQGQGNENLVVILHGDGGPDDAYDSYAKRVAKSKPNTTVVSLTRPGFNGKHGRSRGENPGKDHYTRGNNALLAGSLAAMRKDLRPGRLIVIGHSGGAAQLGTVIGSSPGIVDVAILAGCPCNVPQWRIHRRGENNWKQSQSPHQFAENIPASTLVVAIANAGDSNTPQRFAQEYIAIAQKAGARAQMVAKRGGGHGWRHYERSVDAVLRQTLR